MNTSLLGFAFDGHASKSEIVGAEPITLSIVDWQGYNQGTAYRTWQTDPGDPFKWLSIFDIAAYPGNVKPNTDGNLQDTARFNTFTVYGNAESKLVVNGKATLLRGSLLGPTSALASGAGYFRAKPAADTVAYRYRWTLNNQTISGATDASELVSIGTVGMHVLKVLAERADLTVDTMSKSISVTIGAAFAGQGVLTPHQNYQWSVSPLGGTGPYTYEWYLDAGYLQTGTSYSSAFNANESHRFEVKVTDALNNVGWSSFTFYTTSEAGHAVAKLWKPECCGAIVQSLGDASLASDHCHITQISS